MEELKIETKIYRIDSLEELNEEDRNLVLQAKEIVKKAYAPYSNFKVGTAILLANGKIITGNNQENAAYPSGMCAERVAMYYANSQYPEVPVKTIAISAFYKDDYIDTPIPPCGACRQVLLESELRFKQPIKLLLISKKHILRIDNIKSLLPLNFDESFLEE